MQGAEPAGIISIGATPLIHEALATMIELTGIIDEETELLRAGKIAEGLACGSRKAGAIQRYTDQLASIRKIAISGFPRQEVQLADLRKKHALLEMRLSLNLAVIATIRSVSEGIVRELAQNLAAQFAPRTYGPAGQSPARPGSTPLTLSRNT